MERTIQVTGKGKLSVKPDYTCLFMTLCEKKKTYEETLKEASRQVEQLKECFTRLGFGKEELKTVSFRININYENSKQGTIWKQRMVGYEFRQELKLEFDLDQKLLGKVLYALAHCAVSPVFRIEYTVKDTEKVKNELLIKAVSDSRKKAELLTKAAEVELGQIQTIHYSWEEMEIHCNPMSGVLMARAAQETMQEAEESYAMDMEPDDIDITDTVTVIWEIK